MKPFILFACCSLFAAAPGGPAATTETTEIPETTAMRIHGTFDVTLDSRPADNPDAEAATLIRMSLNKRYHGPLDATGQGEMLAVGDGTRSGAYVAIEKVNGSVDGREGGFALVHSAVMKNGTPEHWSVTVVPDSGTRGLAGIDGDMTITVADGKHHYDFRYTLPGIAGPDTADP